MLVYDQLSGSLEVNRRSQGGSWCNIRCSWCTAVLLLLGLERSLLIVRRRVWPDGLLIGDKAEALQPIICSGCQLNVYPEYGNQISSSVLILIQCSGSKVGRSSPNKAWTYLLLVVLRLRYTHSVDRADRNQGYYANP
jgi:hypothetical protein